jgi:hypothetical protein
MSFGKVLFTIGKIIVIIFLCVLILGLVVYLYQYIKTHISPSCSGNNLFDPTVKYSTSFNVPSALQKSLKNIKSLVGSIQGEKINDTTGTFTIYFYEVHTDGKIYNQISFPDQRYTYNQDSCKLYFELCDPKCVKRNATDYPKTDSKSVTEYLKQFGITLQNPAYYLGDKGILLRGQWSIFPLQVYASPSK